MMSLILVPMGMSKAAVSGHLSYSHQAKPIFTLFDRS